MRELDRRFSRALREMPACDQAIVALAELEQRSIVGIAAELDMTEDDTRRALHAAYNTFALELEARRKEGPLIPLST